MPGAQATEDLGLERLRPGKAQARLHAGQRIGRERGPFFNGESHLVFPVDVVRDESDEAERLRVRRFERSADLGVGRLEAGWIGEQSALEPAQSVRHRKRAAVHSGQPNRRRW